MPNSNKLSFQWDEKHLLNSRELAYKVAIAVSLVLAILLLLIQALTFTSIRALNQANIKQVSKDFSFCEVIPKFSN